MTENAFKQLKDSSIKFEQQLRSLSTEIDSAKIEDSFDDKLSKKLQDYTFLTSKLRLLKAKSLSVLPQITERPKSEESIKEYGELAQWKVLEQYFVKSLTQSHTVKALLTTPDHSLHPKLMQRKEQIIKSLQEFHHQESQLRQLQALEAEKEAELAALRMQWDRELSELRDMREKHHQSEEYDVSGPLYKKLRSLVEKQEVMRWLLGRLVHSRAPCDWLANPTRTAHLLRLASKPYTIEMFLET